MTYPTAEQVRDILDYDPLTGMSTTFNYNHTDDTFSVGCKQECSGIVEAAKEKLATADHRKQMKDDLIHYAYVPVAVQYEWLSKYGVDFGNRDHNKAWMRLLNTEYKHLKTTPITHDR